MPGPFARNAARSARLQIADGRSLFLSDVDKGEESEMGCVKEGRAWNFKRTKKGIDRICGACYTEKSRKSAKEKGEKDGKLYSCIFLD